MATKFYLHRAATGDSGTLPGSGVTISASTPNRIDDGTNYSADTTISAVASTDRGDFTAGPNDLLIRFCSGPLAAQTISGTCQISGAIMTGGGGTFALKFAVAVWRPSTGALVGRLWDGIGGSTDLSNMNPTLTWYNGSARTMSGVTAQKGDILVFEVWCVPGSYGGYFYYDGTLETNADPASYISLSGTISFYAVSGNARVIEYTASGSTETNVAASMNDGTILASNASRKGASIYNDSTSSSYLYLLLSNASSSASNFTIKMAPGGYYELPAGYTGPVKGLWA
jgi:hypothetical protein